MAVTATAEPTPEAIPDGFEQSDVGLLPTGWTVIPLAELFEFRNGVNADKAAYGRGLRFVNVLEVITRTHLVASDIPGRVELPPTTVEPYVVRSGDVVFNRTSETLEEVGLAAVYLGDERVVFGGFVIRGRPISSLLDPSFSSYCLRGPAVRRQIVKRGQGAIRANIGQADLRQVIVPVPPLEEQRVIATFLRDADELISALDRLIEKKKAMKTGAMQELLTGRTRLPGFAGAWETRRLVDVLAFLPTASNPRSDLTDEGEVAYVHYGDIHAHGTPILDFQTTSLPMIARRKVPKTVRLEDGDLIVVDASEDLEGVGTSVEVSGLAGREAVAGLHTILCRGDNGQWAHGFKGYLQFMPTFRTSLQRLATGTSVYGISKRHVGEISLQLPSAPEQAAIAAVLGDMDAEVSALTRQRAKAEAMRSGMFLELLTGRARLQEARSA